MSSTNRYVYGVLRRDDAIEFETEAVSGATTVYPIAHRRLAALVSDIDVTDPEETDDDARRHDEVLREIMKYGDGRTVVPMRFGMVFETDRALKNVLRGARPAFRRTLRTIDGHVELGVKLVREEHTSIDADVLEATVAEQLEPLATETAENDLFSDRLVLNCSYLVPADERGAFDDAVFDLEETHDDVLVRYTGPFAPYSFVDIHIGGQ